MIECDFFVIFSFVFFFFSTLEKENFSNTQCNLILEIISDDNNFEEEHDHDHHHHDRHETEEDCCCLKIK